MRAGCRRGPTLMLHARAALAQENWADWDLGNQVHVSIRQKAATSLEVREYSCHPARSAPLL